MTDILKTKAIALGKEQGFNAVTLYSEYKGDTIFIAENGSDLSYTGYPVFILVNDTSARLATSDETLSIMEIVPIIDTKGEKL